MAATNLHRHRGRGRMFRGLRVYRLLLPGHSDAIVLACDAATLDAVGWTLQEDARNCASISELARQLNAELMIDDVECLPRLTIPEAAAREFVKAAKAERSREQPRSAA